MAGFYATNFFRGDGSNRRFSLTFLYLSKDHVQASINGNAVLFAWSSDSIIDLVKAPLATEIVRIYRETPIGSETVTFGDGSTLLGSDLNGACLQLLYSCQEAADALQVQKTEEQADVARLTAAMSGFTDKVATITAGLEAEVFDRKAALAQEAVTRLAADKTETDTRVLVTGGIQAGLSKEVQDRKDAIAALQAVSTPAVPPGSGTGISTADLQALVNTSVLQVLAGLPSVVPPSGSGTAYLNGNVVMVA